MIRLCLATAAIALGSPLAAQDTGSTATRAVRLYAAAPPSCVVSAATVAQGADNAVFTPDGNGGGTIVISQLVDPDTAEPRAANIALALPVRCNAAHRLAISSDRGGLLRAGGQQSNRLTRGGFADLLPYDIAVDWAGMSSTAPSDGTLSLGGNQPAANGELRVRVATKAGGGALVAGRYSDAITIRFEPAS